MLIILGFFQLLQATHGRNSLDITRQRWQNMASTQRREIQNLQAEQLELKTQISGLLEKLSQVEDRRKRSEMDLDAATHRNAELQQNLERMTRRDSDIQKILQDEASCSICFEIVVNVSPRSFIISLCSTILVQSSISFISFQFSFI